MTDVFADTLAICDKVSELNNYSIDLVLEDNNDYILLSSNTVEYKLSLDEALYFLDSGTISTHGLHILNTISYWINIQLDTRISVLWEKILAGNPVNISLEMQNFENFINIYISNFLTNYSKKFIFTADKDKNLIYPIDTKLFANKLQCKIYKKII